MSMKIDAEKRAIIVDDGRAVFFDEICEKANASMKDIVYLGGSIIEGQLNPIATGMGNKFSDLDVFIIRDHEDFKNTIGVYEKSVSKSFFCDELPLGLDIEVFDKQYMADLANAIYIASIDPNGRIGNVFNKQLSSGSNLEFINSLLCRLKYSFCIRGNKEYQMIYNSFDYSKFLDLMITWSITMVDNGYDDVDGNLSVGQLDAALICIRKIVLRVMEIMLMSRGYFSDRDKWIFLRFKNLCLIDSSCITFWETAFELFRGDLTDNAQCTTKINAAINASKRIIESILLKGNDIL